MSTTYQSNDSNDKKFALSQRLVSFPFLIKIILFQFVLTGWTGSVSAMGMSKPEVNPANCVSLLPEEVLGEVANYLNRKELGRFSVTASCNQIIMAPRLAALRGLKLTVSGAVGKPGAGGVSLSRNGDVVLIAGPKDDEYRGAVWVMTRAGKNWIEKQKLIGEGAEGPSEQGHSVSMSPDGNAVVIGGPGDSECIGAVWVFIRSSKGIWTQEGTKLVGAGFSGKPEQGHAVSISSDARTLLVGGPGDQGGVGAAWVFVRNQEGLWTQQGDKLVGRRSIGKAQQGISVSLSGDGNIAVLGGSHDKYGYGAAWVFARDQEGVWRQQAKLVGSGAVGRASQGYGVALSGDGSTVLVGGWADHWHQGATWVFSSNQVGGWIQQGPKLVGTGAQGGAHQGESLSLSENGNLALIGGSMDHSGVGATWMFRRNANGWVQSGLKFVGGGGAMGGAFQGASTGISADGAIAVTGGLSDDSEAAAAWVWIP